VTCKSTCENSGAVVLLDASLVSSVVESKSKEVNTSARQPFQEGEDGSLLWTTLTWPRGLSPR